jgi:hypothetical protein
MDEQTIDFEAQHPRIAAMQQKFRIPSILMEMRNQFELERETKEELRTLAVEARAAGASWSDIAAAVGITKQSAWSRWCRFTEPRETDAEPQA